MKKLFFVACAATLAIACNNNETKTAEKASETTAATETVAEKLDYPYTLQKPYKNWQIGDQKKAVMVLKFIKAWETKNFTEAIAYCGDSVEMVLDYFHKVVPHDSMLALMNQSWADFQSVNIEMQDWESVISEDKKDEWVTVWYKQKWVDKKGKADSTNMVNDAKIVNGKIVVFDEKVQHFPPVAKK